MPIHTRIAIISQHLLVISFMLNCQRRTQMSAQAMRRGDHITANVVMNEVRGKRPNMASKLLN